MQKIQKWAVCALYAELKFWAMALQQLDMDSNIDE